MIRIRNLAVSFTEMASLEDLAAKRLMLPPQQIAGVVIVRKAVDARRYHGAPIQFVYILDVRLEPKLEKKVLQKLRRDRNVEAAPEPEAAAPLPKLHLERRPVVVGFGPAGMFAALTLARQGCEPLVLERGHDVDTRHEDIQRFWRGGALDPQSNVQFGEGGAGTFSDGKLTTRINDPHMKDVIEAFVAAGAPEEIRYLHKPHIGTDILRDVVRNIRKEIIRLGGTVRFGAQVTDLELGEEGVEAVIVNDEERIETDVVFFGIGHSARDTYRMLLERGVAMEAKPFAMGVRIEHRKADINAAQYGAAAERLPAADYSLSCHLPDGSSAYTFCMCPGGEVFAAASEAGGVCTNGMSNSRRDGENANAAVLVTLRPEDFPDKSTLGGMYWQRSIEQRAFARGGGNYHAPAQLAGDFLAGRASTGPGRVQPTYRPGVTWCDLHDMLPARITDTLAQALPAFGRKLRGFDDPDAVLTAPETRSSSPVRIVRGEDRCSTGVPGLYPCGEGAGYAGGITSAAVDGLRCAESVLTALQNEA